MKNKLQLNMLLNTVKSVMGVIFPLISFPYVSHVLGVANMGEYNFAVSVVSYFILLADLGITTYAVREGSFNRSSVDDFNKFASEILSINIVSTLISYVLLVVSIIFIGRLSQSKDIIVILALQVFFKTIGMEWVYSVYEDYLYITIRSILFQIAAIILLFAFIKSEDDILFYAWITSGTVIVAGIINSIYVKKYCKISLTYKLNLKKHLRPIIILFGMTIAVSIYVSSDITILGFMCNNEVVGIYSFSVKIYTIVKTIVSSILLVSIPQLVELIGEKRKEEYAQMANNIYVFLNTLLMPVIVGLICLRKPIIYLLGGGKYTASSPSLALLGLALFFCMQAWFWSQCVLIPFREESYVFKITILSAVINIILNIIMIPLLKEVATAVTTIIAEAVSFVFLLKKGRAKFEMKIKLKDFLSVFVGCCGIGVINMICSKLFQDSIIYIIVVFACSCIVYYVVGLLMKNTMIVQFNLTLSKKMHKKSF